MSATGQLWFVDTGVSFVGLAFCGVAGGAEFSLKANNSEIPDRQYTRNA